MSTGCITIAKRSSQRGMVMVLALILLAAVTMIGLFGAQSAMLGERIAGNERDRAIALQAAEAGLRDAEATLPLLLRDVIDCEVLFSSTCTNGLCATDATVPAVEIWKNHKAQARSFGTDTGAAALNFNGRAPRRQPEYLIEFFPRDTEVRGVRPVGGETRRSLFRIYSWGYGLNPNTQVLLESLVFPPENFCTGL